jgi:hypothetical protein
MTIAQDWLWVVFDNLHALGKNFRVDRPRQGQCMQQWACIHAFMHKLQSRRPTMLIQLSMSCFQMQPHRGSLCRHTDRCLHAYGLRRPC